MLFKKAKNMLSVCPKTGKRLGPKSKYPWLIWVFPIAGLLSLIWFLIRVVPKPSRATYPCQRLVAPLASGFVVWLMGLLGSMLAYRKARQYLRHSRYVVAGICVVVSVMVIWLSLAVTSDSSATAAFTPTDPPNTPIGVAKGIHPGRVAWLHDPSATSWDSSTGHWWDDDNTDQDAVDYMISKSMRVLTGESNDPNAWDATFRYSNRARGKGDIGYQAGERIVIKINMNNNGASNQIDASPQMVRGLLRQLVYRVGVAQSAITVYDAQKTIGRSVSNCCRPEFPDVGYNANIGWVSNALTYSAQVTNSAARRLPQCVLNADYMINMSVLKRHDLNAPVTLCAKNHFGTIGNPSALHTYVRSWNWPQVSYDPQVDIIGHEDIGGKTVLYIIDGLYGGDRYDATPRKWNSAPFNNDWPSSIFVSQDGVAIDSVGLDFLRGEWSLRDNADRYLHEAAQADNPPSGTFYDPEGDGVRLDSLGVHEHWNNPTDKQYSRNLGTGDGIELVTPSLTSPDGPIENVNAGKRYDYIRLAINDAGPNDEIVVSPGIYSDSINLGGKNLTLRSADPSDPAVVAATIISGGDRAVTFSGGEDASCVLAGFTITGANTGIYCSDASPTINTCAIPGNGGAGIELHNGSNPTIINCGITANAGAGVQMWALAGGRVTINNRPIITNCTIAGNLQGGISGGIPTITNSIIWGNLPEQIAEAKDTVAITYSDVQGGLQDEGNINADPLFADPGNGDYHLKSQAGRWDANSQTWVQDQVTSPCIDAGDPSTPIGFEPSPNGGVVNMGAYGGMVEASKSI
jgi:hypothetical protein